MATLKNLRKKDMWNIFDNEMKKNLDEDIECIYSDKFIDNKCSSCGWNQINPFTNKIPLEIDHIDGNCENTKPENLRVLCPNCHSLTSTFRALNKGKGNKTRLKYNKLI